MKKNNSVNEIKKLLLPLAMTLLLFTACGTDQGNTTNQENATTQASPANQVSPTSQASPAKHEYPAAAAENFVDSCAASSDGKRELCLCVLDKVQQKYTFEEFSRMDEEMQAGETPSEFLDFMGKARAECTKE
jgi:hypothetical protein